jgi:hypothetical protein
MKIHIDLEISSDPLNDASMEALRVRLRREMLAFIFDCADKTPVGDGATTIRRLDLVVDGSITLKV